MKTFSYFHKHNDKKPDVTGLVNPENMKKEYESYSLTNIIVNTWKSLNADLLSPYLTDDFQYNSVWVSDTIKGKEQYMDYLQGKFETLKKSGDAPIVDVINECGCLRPRLRQQGTGVSLY